MPSFKSAISKLHVKLRGLQKADTRTPSRVASSGSYQYLPLRPELPNETRLLTLHAGKFNDQIEVSIHNVDLSASRPNVEEYESLSYVWGSPENNFRIDVRPSVDGEQAGGALYITENLDTALRYLRYADRPRVMWIDAICINQIDLTERSRQVSWMGQIYRKASRTVVFLGEQEKDSETALRLIADLGSKIVVDWTDYTLSSSEKGKSEPHWATFRAPLDYSPDELRAIYRLLHRPWFGRLWIRQEIALSTDAIVQCGHTVVPWVDFQNAVFCLRIKQSSTFVLDDGNTSAYIPSAIDMASSVCWRDRAYPLYALMFDTQEAKCTDPKDRIYAILAFLERHNLEIRPDYTLDTVDVFRDVIVRSIFRLNSLVALSNCRMKESPHDFPSWVPDWADTQRPRPLYFGLANGSTRPFAEAIGHDTLRLTGVPVTEITEVATLPYLQRDYQHRLREQQVKTIAERVNIMAPYTGGGTYLEAYRDALSAGVFHEAEDPPKTDAFPKRAATILLRQILWGEDPGQEDLRLYHEKTTAPEQYLSVLCHTVMNRVFFWTKGGYVGLGAEFAQPGDKVVVFLGCARPMVVRPVENGKYKLVGDAYVPGLMNGEAILGPLPSGVYYVWAPEGMVLRDPATGRQAYPDERLRKFPWSVSSAATTNLDDNQYEHLTPNVLSGVGVPVEEFDLI
jgi:hypothetical protein